MLSNRSLTCSFAVLALYSGEPQAATEGMAMWKAIVGGTAALAIAGSSLVYAQQRGWHERGGHGQPNIEDMRAFGEADAFPCGDLVLRKAAGEPSPAALELRSTAWRPWRAYAAMHLWSSASVPLEAVHDRAVAS